ncbi:hypothetical protein QBC44DRAFT_366696 [Cladorrhinum sp. PSN332]|nr:hypothetical protein QBC44DRAFT_366696 [Cladorrhinum sp. PSN332]
MNLIPSNFNPTTADLLSIMLGAMTVAVNMNLNFTTRAPWTLSTLKNEQKPLYPWQTDIVPNAENSSMCNIVATLTYRGPKGWQHLWGLPWNIFWFDHDFLGVPYIEPVSPGGSTQFWTKNSGSYRFHAPSYLGLFAHYDDSVHQDSDYSVAYWNASDLPNLECQPFGHTGYNDTTGWTFIVGGPQDANTASGTVAPGRAIYAHKRFRCMNDSPGNLSVIDS